jgi:small subunit ribosomal protein S10
MKQDIRKDIHSIYIKIKAFDPSLLERCVRKFINELRLSNVNLSGPILLPTKKTKFTVNRSVHVDKKSREQFEERRSKRLVILHNVNADMMKMLQDLSFSAGVEVDLKVVKNQ